MEIIKTTTTKTFKHDVELSTLLGTGKDTAIETEWTMTFENGIATDINIVSCDGDLDERQYDELVNACWRAGDLVENREEYCRQLGIEYKGSEQTR